MQDNIKKLNHTIASFMLVSFALSAQAFANINNNLISNGPADMGGISEIQAGGVSRALYGVPSNPPVMAMYGVPSMPPDPINHALYGVPSGPEVVPVYGVPSPHIVEPLYGVPPITRNVVQPENNLPVKPSEVIQQYNLPSQAVNDSQININTNRVKDPDSKTPAGYIVPVFIKNYYAE